MEFDINHVLRELSVGRTLKQKIARRLFLAISENELDPAQLGAVLMAYALRPADLTELQAAVSVFREGITPFKAPKNAMDTCGTGGDGLGTFNISTATAIVLAGGGVPVVKYGNKSISSPSGSADVLVALDVVVQSNEEEMENALADAKVCFLSAPLYHNTLRLTAEIRRDVGIRSLFNVLGPLLNPARVRRQIIGVYDKHYLPLIAQILKDLNTAHALVVHGEDGLDEITTTGKTFVKEVRNGEIRDLELHPEAFGIPKAKLADLKGGDAKHNAQAIRALLDGKKDAYRDIIVLNAAAGFYVAGKAKDVAEGIPLAEQSIDTGKAKESLEKLAYHSQR